jgi:hypothetical protein
LGGFSVENRVFLEHFGVKIADFGVLAPFFAFSGVSGVDGKRIGPEIGKTGARNAFSMSKSGNFGELPMKNRFAGSDFPFFSREFAFFAFFSRFFAPFFGGFAFFWSFFGAFSGAGPLFSRDFSDSGAVCGPFSPVFGAFCAGGAGGSGVENAGRRVARL